MWVELWVTSVTMCPSYHETMFHPISKNLFNLYRFLVFSLVFLITRNTYV